MALFFVGAISALKYVACGMMIANGIRKLTKGGQSK